MSKTIEDLERELASADSHLLALTAEIERLNRLVRSLDVRNSETLARIDLMIERHVEVATAELLPIVEAMAAEDCESFCGEVCEEGEDDHCDPDTECWPTRASAILIAAARKKRP